MRPIETVDVDPNGGFGYSKQPGNTFIVVEGVDDSGAVRYYEMEGVSDTTIDPGIHINEYGDGQWFEEFCYNYDRTTQECGSYDLYDEDGLVFNQDPYTVPLLDNEAGQIFP